MRPTSQNPANEKNTLTSPTASASARGGAPARTPGLAPKFDQCPSPTVNARRTIAANASSLKPVMTPNTLALNLSPSMLSAARIQIVPMAMEFSEPFTGGHNTTRYCDAPVVSAAVTPGSMMSSACQP
jgi:hypothetical protein